MLSRLHAKMASSLLCHHGSLLFTLLWLSSVDLVLQLPCIRNAEQAGVLERVGLVASMLMAV
jgi:hypothetical protein